MSDKASNPPQDGVAETNLETPSSFQSVQPANLGNVNSLHAQIGALTAQLQQAEDALHAQKEQFQAVLDAVPGGVSWIDKDLVYLGANEHLTSLFGLKPKDFIGQPIGFLNNSPAFSTFVHEFVHSAEQNGSRELDVVVDGERHVFLFMAKKYRLGQSALFVGIDITDRKLAEEKLFRNAFYDKLTGLPNRSLLLERMERSLEYAKRHKQYLFAVLFLDFDGFKNVNDSLGHTNGDRLLASMARRLESATRSMDTVARLGGDEFVILLEDIEGLHSATHIAERIQRALVIPFTLEGQEVFMSVSIGITLNTVPYEQTDELLRDADTAMYRAKILGRNRYEVFDRQMHEQAMNRLQMETDLHKGIEQKAFLLHYQPIVDIEARRLNGFEALVRWQRPQRGFTAPGEFLGLAEETGLIVQIDRWVMTEACRQINEWRAQFPDFDDLTVAVNLSSRQFLRRDFLEFVRNMLAETQLPPRHLKMEITESALMENIQTVAEILNELRDLGIRISIDDFGTGYSSLSYLHRLPLNTLKVDRSFISDMETKQENHEIVRAIVTLAHNLHMNVVAEGIETETQLERCRELNCQFAQGHYFSKALTVEDATQLLQSGGQW
jgi:diguanylate cyclase (GGDEF)-like protein/PAS domain S-box-containing protein